MRYYVYTLHEGQSQPPFYAGFTTDTVRRLAAHKKRFGSNIILEVNQKFNNADRAAAKERWLIKHLISQYGFKKIKNCSLMLGRKYVRKSSPKIQWVYLTKKDAKLFYFKLKRGECYKIAKECGVTQERIRLIFKDKPVKLNPNIFNGISMYKNKKGDSLKTGT